MKTDCWKIGFVCYTDKSYFSTNQFLISKDAFKSTEKRKRTLFDQKLILAFACFGFFLISWHMNPVGYLMPKPPLSENSSNII